MQYERCIDCPNHKVVEDPDPTDWFNQDDVALVCTKVMKVTDKKSEYLVDRYPFKSIDTGLRPYQTKNVKVPQWCPISISALREKKLNEIIK